MAASVFVVYESENYRRSVYRPEVVLGISRGDKRAPFERALCSS